MGAYKGNYLLCFASEQKTLLSDRDCYHAKKGFSSLRIRTKPEGQVCYDYDGEIKDTNMSYSGIPGA